MAGANGLSSKSGPTKAAATTEAKPKMSYAVRKMKEKAARGQAAKANASGGATAGGQGIAHATPEQFASAVKADARKLAASGNANQRFGDNKVFISALHEKTAPHMPLDQFKQKLLDAHRRGLLTLSRADLVEAMPAKAVSRSEINHLSASFHLVRAD